MSGAYKIQRGGGSPEKSGIIQAGYKKDILPMYFPGKIERTGEKEYFISERCSGAERERKK